MHDDDSDGPPRFAGKDPPFNPTREIPPLPPLPEPERLQENIGVFLMGGPATKSRLDALRNLMTLAGIAKKAYANPSELVFDRHPPNAPGWWARSTGEVKWFFVEDFDDGTPLSIWDEDRAKFVPVSEYHRPLLWWAGPLKLKPVPGTEE